MSDLFRKTVNGVDPAPPHRSRRDPSDPTTIPELDEASSSSDSSASSADSSASINTIRPTQNEHAASPSHWTAYFAQELYLDHTSDNGKQRARYHVYITPPSDVSKGPLFICHHGAGSSGMSFAVFAKHLRRTLPNAGILSLEARAHGSTVTDTTTNSPITDFSLVTVTADALAMVNLTKAHFSWPAIPPCVLLGHSLGGAVITQLASDFALGTALIGYSVIDVVEGSALEALSHMKTYLASRPTAFTDVDEAVQWHIRSRTIRDKESAEASVPTLLVKTQAGQWTWQTDLQSTSPWWDGWFAGMSTKFLGARGAKMLILAGTDRLDKDLMIGQMQGKFQLVVIPEAGHFVQEDVPEKTAQLMTEFFRRNDRSALVLPPKVNDLIAQGKKV